MDILIVDDHEDAVDAVEMIVKSFYPCTITKAYDGIEAIEVLESRDFDLVISDYHMPRATGGKIYKRLLKNEHRAQFVLISSDLPSDHPEFNDTSKLFGSIQKTSVVDELEKILKKFHSENFPSEEASYFPISIKLLLKLDPFENDLYIKISGNKFVKAIHSHDKFDEADFLKYQKKSIHSLYADQENASSIRKDVEEKIFHTQKESREKKDINSSSKSLELIISLTQDFGLSEVVPKIISEQIAISLAIIESSNELDLLLKKLLKNQTSYLTKHSMMLSVFTVMVSNQLQWSNKAIIHKLVVASLFHDITLKDDENIESFKLGVDKSQEFLSHPSEACKLLSGIEAVPKDTEVIILEQHEVGSDVGFPQGTSFAYLSPLGSLFSFCHYFVDFLLESGSFDQALEEIRPFSNITGQHRKFCEALKAVQV